MSLIRGLGLTGNIDWLCFVCGNEMKKVEMNRAMTRARVPQQDVGQSSVPLVIGRCFSYSEFSVFGISVLVRGLLAGQV